MIVGALTWFYEEAQRSTGTDLDDWYNYEAPAGTYPTVPFVLIGGGSDKFFGPSENLTNVASTWLALGGTPYSLAGLAPYVRASTPMAQTARCGAGTYTTNITIYLARPTHYTTANLTAAYLTAASLPCPPPGLAYADVYEYYAQQYADDAVAYWYAQLNAAPVGENPSLPNLLASRPDLADALRDQVLIPYGDENIPETGDPSTFTNPWPGVDISFDPPLTWPLWTDDPYADPAADTDQDGYPDWIEWRLGTDPFNPGSRPVGTSDPDGDGRTNAQEAVAVTDPLDGGSYDAGQTPGADPNATPVQQDLTQVTEAIQQLEAELADLLAGVSQESQQVVQIAYAEAQLAELVALRESIEEQAAFVDPDALAVPLDAWTPLPLTSQVWDDAMAATEVHVAETWAVLQTKFPFGMAAWVPTALNIGTYTCPTIPIVIGGVTGGYDICENPLDDFMRTVMRPMLAVLMFLSFGFAVVRRTVSA